jgi:non-ribosomal peptide synthase protein (TIGR01720 family)
VLGLDTVGVRDSFFALGGDSIVSMRLVAQARAAGLALSPRDVFEQPTVEGLARRATPAGPARAAGGDGTGDMPLTPVLAALVAQGGPFRRLSQARFLRTPPGLDLDGLHRVVQAVLDRHDLLRATLTHDGSRRLTVAPAGSVAAAGVVRRIDAAHLDHAAVGTLVPGAFDELAGELDPAEGAVARFLWYDAGADREGRLLVVLHHLVTDAASWGVLVADLAAAGTGAAPSPPGTSFKQWAEALHTEARTPRRTAELALWEGILDRPEPRLGAAALNPSVDTTATLRTHWTTYVPGAPLTGDRVRETLLTALALAVPAWRRALGRPAPDDDTSVLIALESHGREEHLLPGADLSTTMGRFTTLFPVRLDPGPAPGRRQLLRVRAQLTALPDGGIGHGLLRHLNPDTAARLARLPAPQIRFHHLGRPASGERRDCALFTGAPETGVMGGTADPDMPVPYALAVDAALTGEAPGGDGAGPVLRVSWQWPDRHFTRAEIEQLAELWVGLLDELRKGEDQ